MHHVLLALPAGSVCFLPVSEGVIRVQNGICMFSLLCLEHVIVLSMQYNCQLLSKAMSENKSDRQTDIVGLMSYNRVSAKVLLGIGISCVETKWCS